MLIEGVAAQNNCFVNLFVFVYYFSVKFVILLLDGQVGHEPALILMQPVETIVAWNTLLTLSVINLLIMPLTSGMIDLWDSSPRCF